MTAKILKFKNNFVSAVACCDNCSATWIAHIRAKEFNKYLKGSKKTCPYCKSQDVYFCTRSKNEIV